MPEVEDKVETKIEFSIPRGSVPAIRQEPKIRRTVTANAIFSFITMVVALAHAVVVVSPMVMAAVSIFMFSRGQSTVAAQLFTPLHLYYMSTSGSDANNGLTPATAWLTPNHSVVCGDVIIALSSNSYTEANGGFGNVTGCPSTSGGIDGHGGIWFAALLCAGPDLNSCNLTCGTTGGTAFSIGNNWAISGWRINGGGTSNCRGIESNACASGTTINHHNLLINSVVYNARTVMNTNECVLNHNVPGNGTDYFAAIGNLGMNSAQDQICTAAVVSVAPANFDSAAGTHTIFYGNILGVNQVPGGCPSDGEALMFDTWDAHGYTGQGVILNNILWRAERFGIQLFYQAFNVSSPNVFVENNSSYGNSALIHCDFSIGEIGIQATGATLPWVITITKNISQASWPWQGNAPDGTTIECPPSGTAGAVYALQLGGNYASTTIGGTGSENILKGLQTSCAGTSCDAGNNAAAFNGGSLGTNIYTDPLYTSPSNLVGQSTSPTCAGFASVTACAGWNANTSTLTTPSIISDIQASCTGCGGKGYQSPSTTCVTTGAISTLYPTWLKGMNRLGYVAGASPPSTAQIFVYADLATKPCGL